MKRFTLFASVICLTLTISVFTQTNQNQLIKSLLDLPAPPPSTIQIEENETVEKEYPREFFEKSKVPPDDAPIEDLLAYWLRQSADYQELRYAVKPSDIVVQRILDEIEKEPDILASYVNIFPSKPEVAKIIKRLYDQQNDKNERFVKNDEDESENSKNVNLDQILTEAIDKTKNRENSPTNYYELSQVKKWLTYNSNFYVDELLKSANKVRDKDEYLTNHDELIALAKVDWQSAEPIVEKLSNDSNQPVSAVAAKWAYYKHFLQEEDDAGISKYRREVLDVVEDQKAKPGARDLAMDALVSEEEWDGRDDWYLSLLADETLYELKVNNSVFTGLTTIVLNSAPEKWIPKMIALVGNQNQNVHNAAVRNLASILNQGEKEVVKVLMPWLANPAWAKDFGSGRRSLITAVSNGDYPESIPGLISIIQNDENHRSQAVSALSKYKDPRIVPILQNVLEQTEDRYPRDSIIKAILESNGYSAIQQVTYLEDFAKFAVNLQVTDENYSAIYYGTGTISLNVQIGMAIARITEPDENLVRTAFLKVKTLQKSNPPVAEFFNNIVKGWKSSIIDLERLNQIGSGTADLDTIIRVLTKRREIGEKFKNDVYALRAKKGFAAGIAACLLNNENETANALNTNDPLEKTVLLGCARMIRAKLPVAQVGQIMNSSDGLLKLAAERYLISEDSSEARNLVLVNYPNEALILGARFSFTHEDKLPAENLPLDELFSSVNAGFAYLGYSSSYKFIDKFQEKLREEVKKDNDLQGIYSMIENAESGHKVLRIYKDRAVYRWYEDSARYNERNLKKEELNAVFRFVSEIGIAEWKPLLGGCHHGCQIKEFTMLGRGGGRRIFIYGNFYPNPLEGLAMIFSRLEQEKSDLRYHLQDKIEGLEVLLADKNFEAKSVWKQGNDLRIMVLDNLLQKQIETEISEISMQERQALVDLDRDDDDYYEKYDEIENRTNKRRRERLTEPFLWRTYNENKLQIETMSPPDNLLTYRNSPFPAVEELETPENIWNARTTNFEIRTGNYNKGGLWKVAPNGSVSSIAEENFGSPVVTPDGKWAAVTKHIEDTYFQEPYRINLQTGKATKIALKQAPFALPITFVAAHNSILIRNSGSEKFKELPPYYIEQLKEKFGKDILESQKKTEYFLLDPQSGALKPVSGEFAPLEQITYRNLQTTGKAGEFWAAIYDEDQKQTKIGRYDSGQFKFTEVMTIPEIALTSMDIWVNEKDAKVYFVYQGHVLSLPLSKPTQP